MASFVSRRGQKPAWRRAFRPDDLVLPAQLTSRDDEGDLESSDDDDSEFEPDTPVTSTLPAAVPIQPIVTLTPIAPPRTTRPVTTVLAAPPTSVVVIAEPQPTLVASSTRVLFPTSLVASIPTSTQSASISFMTTVPIARPSLEASAPRKELEPQTRTVTATVESALLPSETLSALPGQGSIGEGNGRERQEEEGRESDRSGKVDSTTQHVLIGVGSIGAFIFACFLGWLIWRATRRSRKDRRDSLYSAETGLRSTTTTGRFVAKVPFLRNMAWGRGWQNLGTEKSGELPSSYEKAEGPLQINTNVYNGHGLAQPLGSHPAMARPFDFSPVNTVNMRNNAMDGSGLTFGVTQGPRRSVSLSSIVDEYAAATDPNLTLRSGTMPQGGTYYNQSELARQPSNAYDPARRQVNRASELSSISSGFGDGDIIIPAMPQQPQPVSQGLRPSQNGADRASWLDKDKRDTVYTQHSEDSPPRFRTISSWVNQQTGRINRAQERAAREQREAEDIPPVPGLPAGTGRNGMPPEPEFTMMMPDGEVPRRVEDMGRR